VVEADFRDKDTERLMCLETTRNRRNRKNFQECKVLVEFVLILLSGSLFLYIHIKKNKWANIGLQKNTIMFNHWCSSMDYALRIYLFILIQTRVPQSN